MNVFAKQNLQPDLELNIDSLANAHMNIIQTKIRCRILCFQVHWCSAVYVFLDQKFTFSHLPRKNCSHTIIIALNWNNEVSGVLPFIRFADLHCFIFCCSISNYGRHLLDGPLKILPKISTFKRIYLILFSNKFRLTLWSVCFELLASYFHNSLQLKCVFNLSLGQYVHSN